ncbi:molybdate ABC transporter substrate-binding protein [Pantoea cypripedii]|uniref:molybdate ABC transporter substrate-binding protein n=1 Tax=Pantoea cypripedii TaxID=55209 RepID=UPI0020C7A5AD|nr:substrate-binding domain-containing protein [Pantoea cypripedii]
MIVTLQIYSALALSAPFERLTRLWQATYPHIALQFRWHPSSVIEQQINAGQGADVVIATVETLDRLTQSGQAETASRIELVDSPIGLAVLAGAPKPAIHDTQALVQSLLAARSVAWSEAGASGIYFSGLLKTLGIDDALRDRGTVIPAGFTAEQLVNGKADVAVQQISELLMVEGIEIVGPLPAEVQQPISLSAALLATVQQREAAETLLAWLKTPAVTDVFSHFGLVSRS